MKMNDLSYLIYIYEVSGKWRLIIWFCERSHLSMWVALMRRMRRSWDDGGGWDDSWRYRSGLCDYVHLSCVVVQK